MVPPALNLKAIEATLTSLASQHSPESALKYAVLSIKFCGGRLRSESRNLGSAGIYFCDTLTRQLLKNSMINTDKRSDYSDWVQYG